MEREWHDPALLVRYEVFRRQHVVDAYPAIRPEDALREGIGHEALDFLGTLSLCAQFGDFHHARQMRARALRVHTDGLLTGRECMRDHGGKAVLALPNLHVAGFLQDVDRSLACDRRRTRA